MSAANAGFVDLSWDATKGVSDYLITRDGKPLTRVTGTTFRDADPIAGLHWYLVEPVTVSPTQEAPSWGLHVKVPEEREALAQFAAGLQTDAVSPNNFTIAHLDMFIPQQYVAAPPAGCTYSGSNYEYRGDNRTWSLDPYADARVFEGFDIQWQPTYNPSTGTAKSVEPTAVYLVAGPTFVASASASTAGLRNHVLPGSTPTQVSLRFEVSAGNPFCSSLSAIEGAFTLQISRTGTWSIISGSHRQMPNWELNIGSNYTLTYSTFSWVPAYRKQYANLACLVAIACTYASMSGYVGTY